MHKLDVIIPTYNNLKELKQCLKHFEKQTEKDFRILLCVDGSTDGTLEWLKSYKPDFKLEILTHQDNEHKGKEKTRNLTLKKLTAPYVLFFDSDLFPTENLVAEHLNLLREGIVSLGSIVYLNAEENLWAYYSNTRGVEKFPHLAEVPYIYFHTGNSAMPTKYFTETGGQYENFTGYGGDDSELMFRIYKKFQPKVIVNKKAKAYSYMNKTLAQALQQRYLMGKTNLKIIAKLHPDEDNYYKLKWLKHKGLVGKLFPVIMNPLFAKTMEKIAFGNFPLSLKLKAIHFLTIYNMYKGFHEE